MDLDRAIPVCLSEDEVVASVPAPNRVVEFYEAAGMDYEHWSRNFNMHIGYYRRGMNPFDREAMLEQLNLEVADRLHVGNKPAILIDLGCGVGAVARSIARKYAEATIKGITIVPQQVRVARELAARQGLDKRIEFHHGDFTALPFGSRSADGVWVVESTCYANGPDKSDLIREMARVLKTGGRFVISDCFVKRPEKSFDPLTKWCYRTACKNWAVGEMPILEDFLTTLKKYNFTDIIVEDISWRAAPSVAHAPFAVLTFVLKKLASGRCLGRQSLNNLKASLLAPVFSANRSKFSYCLISGIQR